MEKEIKEESEELKKLEEKDEDKFLSRSQTPKKLGMVFKEEESDSDSFEEVFPDGGGDGGVRLRFRRP